MTKQTNNRVTCEQRIDAALDSRMRDLRVLYAPTQDMVRLADDGTLDTVLTIGDEEFRFSDTSAYRDDDGALDLDAVLEDEWDYMLETLWERQSEYGLSFDYHESDTDEPGYFSYLLSWGGPSEEIRFYVDYAGHMHRAAFVFKDWFDSAERTLHDEYRDVANAIWESFSDYGMCDRP